MNIGNEDSFKYFAFISYSHRDKSWGKWLHRKLETYALPKDLVPASRLADTDPARLYPVFRDYEELPTSSNLGAHLQTALEQSRFLVVICSPHSAQSEWVGEEIATFKRLGREHRVLPFIIAGEPNARFKADEDSSTECFHEALQWKYDANGQRTKVRTEPIAADARPGHGGRNRAFLKIVAGLSDVGFAELDRRDARRRSQRKKAIAGLTFSLVLIGVALSGFAIWNWREAEFQRSEAALQQEIADAKAREADVERKIAAQRRADLHAREASRWMSEESDPTRALFYYEQAAQECRAASIDGSIYALQIQKLIERMPLSVTPGEALAISSAEFNPNGDRIVTASEDGTARVWDARTGDTIGAPLVHEDRVYSAVFSPDGNQILTTFGTLTRENGKARLWDARSGSLLREFANPHYGITRALFSPDGRRIVTRQNKVIGMSSDAQIWDAESGEPVGEILDHTGGIINSILFSPDGSQIVTAAELLNFGYGFAQVWDAATGKPIGKPMRNDLYIHSAKFSPDGERVLTASGPKPPGAGEGMAQLWDASTGEALQGEMKHDLDVSSASFSPDGTMIITTSWDKSARLWSGATGVPLGRPMEHDHWVSSALFSPDGRWFLTSFATYSIKDRGPGWVQMFDASTGRRVSEPIKHGYVIKTAAFSPQSNYFLTLSWGTARVWDIPKAPLRIDLESTARLVASARYSHDGSRILSSNLHDARIFDATTGNPIGTPMEHEFVRAYAISPDDRRIVTGSGRGTIHFWDSSTGQSAELNLDGDNGVYGLAFSPQGDRILAICSQGGISGGGLVRIWDAATGEPTGIPLKNPHTVNLARWSPDGQRVVTASGRRARVWDVNTGKAISELMEHEESVHSIEFSPDGQRVATASGNTMFRKGRAYVWDAQSGALIANTWEHEGTVSVATFSPDGALFATSSYDMSARVWDSTTGDPVTNPLLHRGPLRWVEFSSDGKWIVTGSDDGTARVWEAETGVPVGAPMQHDRYLISASFSPDGKYILTVTDNALAVWEFGAIMADVPEWMTNCAEAVSGLKLEGAETLTPLPADEYIQGHAAWIDDVREAASQGDEAAQFVIRRWHPEAAGVWTKPHQSAQ